MNTRGKLQTQLLATIYVRAGLFHRGSWACGKGCASCCTRSVTMTTLEGGHILAYLRQHKMAEQPWRDEKETTPHRAPPMTTNGLAARYLAGDEEAAASAAPAPWDFTPCVFLAQGCCTIYPVRPFSCRCFLSTVRCENAGYAVVPPEVVTVNTIFHQLIEHLDQGGFWGNMHEVLAHLSATASERDQAWRLLPCQPLPGFLIPPGERKMVMEVVNGVFQAPVAGFSFVEILKQVAGK